METLEKKLEKSQNDEINEILEAQKNIDELVLANSDSIKKLKEEMEME